ncbi:MAG: cytochrome b/b6 domain-containing protein [Pseudomonadota bacterium]
MTISSNTKPLAERLEKPNMTTLNEAKPRPPYRRNPEGFSVARREAMAYRFIKKHHVVAMLLHWFNAVVWLGELVTGAALVVADKYRFVPSRFNEILLGVFGSRAELLTLHIGIGVLWVAVLLIYGVFGFKTYFLNFLRNDLVMDRDDLSWLKNKLRQILGLDYRLPEQDIYNAGQKCYAWVVVGTLGIAITGFVMAFHLGPLWLIQWSIPVHFALVGAIVAGLVIHIYMGAILPEERPAFFSMLHGRVNELYAYEHHTKWWRSYKEDERRLRDRLVEEEVRD